MVDRLFSEPLLAELYDLLAPWGAADDAFYFDLVMAAESVLDVGCGTGLLLREARKAGHTGCLVGLDPAAAMLDVARECRDIDWVQGDLSTVAWEAAFDLIVMTGHAFQVFLTDEQLLMALAAIRRALAADGCFAFETRNPSARAWERWTPDHVTAIVASQGERVHFSRDVETPVSGDLVRFTATFASPAWERPQLSRSTLRFLDAGTLSTFLAATGMAVAEQYGDWDRSPLIAASPEIITLACRK